ncbi:ribokinase [Ktedonobacteria bacterium brp13]|nr:ribokinase [Ktedonobacteria bacterium brp13]
MSIVVLGSINFDLSAQIARRPQPGETLMASAFSTSPGGKGANQALAARRMGAAVTMIGAVGQDDFATGALSLLQADGVDLSYVRTIEGGSTGLAFIHLDEAGENSITVIPGANAQGAQEALRALEQVLSPHDMLVMQLEVPFSTVLAAIAIAKRKGAAVLIDPAPSPASVPDDLVAVDIFIPNRSEAEQILGHRISSGESARAAAEELRKRGARIGIVKLGSDGVAWATEQGTFYEPAYKVQPIDTTGAGDAFAGALAAFMDSGYQVNEAIVMANHAAALATEHMGAQKSFPYKQDVLSIVR